MDLVSVLIALLVFCAIVWLGFWILGQMALPEPMNRFARIIWGVICLVVLVGYFAGGSNYISVGRSPAVIVR